MALRKTVAVLCVVALVTPAPLVRAQARRPPQTPNARGIILPAQPDAACRDIVAALESKDPSKARQLIERYPKSTQFVLEHMPLSPEAQKTAFDVRRRILQDVMIRTVDALPPDVREKVISLEVGGSAGKQERARLEGRPAPAFQPKRADLDWQIRAESDEDARKAVEIAQKIMKEMDIPPEFGIHVFPVLRTRPEIAGTTSAQSATQAKAVEQMMERLGNPESGLIDTADVVELDHFENGVGYEIDKNSKRLTSQPKAVSQIFEEHKLPPPEPTADTAFGRAANEYSKFEGLALDSKRVLRAGEAFERAGFNVGSLPPEERRVIDLAQRLRAGPDAVTVLEQWVRDHPSDAVALRYRKLVTDDRMLRTEAASQVLTERDADANAMLRHVMERTLEARVTEIENLQTMSDSQFVDYMEKRGKSGDVEARKWLENWMKGSARESNDMLKAAKESYFEAKQQALVESFAAIDPETRGQLIQQKNFAGRDVVRNAALFAEVMKGNLESWTGLERLRSPRGTVLTPEQAAAVRKGSVRFMEMLRASSNLMEVDAAGNLGQGTHRGSQLLMGMAYAGVLWDAYDATIRAYEQGGGDLAASLAFLKVVAANSGQIVVGAMVFNGAQRASYMVEALGWLPRGATAVATAAILARDVVRMSQALMTRAYQRYALDTRLAVYLDPDNADSFYKWTGIRSDFFVTDLRFWAQQNGYGHLADEHEMLVEAMRWFLQRRGGSMVGLQEQLLAPLEFELRWNQELMTELGLVMRTDVPLTSAQEALDLVRADERRRQRELEAQKAAAKKVQDEAEKRRADAEEADRLAKKKQKQDEQDRAKKAADEKRTADEEAQKKQDEPPAPPATKPSTQQSRLDQLRAQKEEEDRLRAEAEAEARRAAEERAAEERRRYQEAVLLEQVRVRLRVPSSLPVGGQGSIEVSVTAPQGLSLAGRHVTVVVKPGHTDERAVRINSSGVGRTVYTADPGYNGYVRVQASLDGYGGTARSFPVGKVVTPAPADTPPVTPPKPVPPTQVPSTPVPSTPQLSPAGLPMGDFAVTLSGDDGLSGRLEVRGGRASGSIAGPMSGEGVSGTQELTWTESTYNSSTGLTQGSATFRKSIRIQQADMNGSVTATARVEIRLQLRAGGPAKVEFTIREVGNVQTTGDIEASSLDRPGDVYGFDARWRLTSR